MINSLKLFLVGMPGCGKSTLGRELAIRLGRTFLDLDDEIEQSTSSSIKQIFEQKGEAEFRKIEQKQLHQSIEAKDTFIMATGGGTPCFFDNMDVLLKSGVVIFLDVPVDTIVSRLSQNSGTQDRPLLADHSNNDLMMELSKKLEERRSYYIQASHIMSKSNIDVEEILALLSK